MNSYITLACLLAVVATGHGSGYGGLGGLGGLGGYGGYGGLGSVEIIKTPIYAPAISTQNLIKAAPIPIIRSVAVSPIITAPVLKTIPVSTYGLGLNGGYGYGLSSLGGLGLGGGYWGKGKYL